MARRVFYSFHYEPDNWRAAQVRNSGLVEGNQSVSDNDWEKVKRGGDAAIQTWIDGQLLGRSCTVVLIGSATAGRKWINYEIRKSWEDGRGLLGIHIHNLRNREGLQSNKGANPFGYVLAGRTPLSSLVKTYDPPPSRTSTTVYEYIATNLADWVEEAIAIRRVH
ncbi:TIR domain-containing protein [Microbispora bryophytorum]|uniref:TIR domain-containing protein n=1 Tax=Microbispora bryophytorum TaxID=1460882 RepID=UPI0033E466C0